MSAGLAGAAFGVVGTTRALATFIALTTRNRTAAMIRKLTVTCRKLPQASTAPCFLASAKAGAVTFEDSGVK